MIVAPILVLCLFAAVLPARLTGGTSGPSNEECLTLAERAAVLAATVEQLEYCSAMFPDDVELLGDLAGVREGRDPAAAERLYSRALQIDPDYADLRLRLGRLQLARGDARGALAQAQRALAVQPNRDALLNLKAAALRAISGAAK